MKKPGIEISNLSKNCNEALILAILAQGDRHGYQIALEIEEQSGGKFSFNHGTLYPILHKLEKDGMIKGIWENDGTKRKRKYYKIIPKGNKYYELQRSEWRNFFTVFLPLIDGEKT